MLVGASLSVLWASGRERYNGTVRKYESNGKNAGKHQVVYSDGDSRYYTLVWNAHVATAPYYHHQPKKLQAPNKGDSSDLHTFTGESMLVLFVFCCSSCSFVLNLYCAFLFHFK